MTKNDLQYATVEDFFYWINERHQIYINRFIKKQKKPWTDDKIFQQYKFTNVFRQLDTGTIALDKMLGKWFQNDTPLHDMGVEDAIDILFNVVWYRLFNLADHAEDIGFQSHKDHEFIFEVLRKKSIDGKKVFTSAHMTTGTGEVIQKKGKIYGHMIAPKGIAEELGEEFISYIFYNQTIEAVTKKLCELPMIGNFIAYEIACDLRFTPLLSAATDKLIWANIGPGAERGMLRLGMDPSVESMIELYNLSIDEEMVGLHIAEHFPFNINDAKEGRTIDETYNIPFELREIEHSLCEFDKYMRVKTGAGRPRQKYEGV